VSIRSGDNGCRYGENGGVQRAGGCPFQDKLPNMIYVEPLPPTDAVFDISDRKC